MGIMESRRFWDGSLTGNLICWVFLKCVNKEDEGGSDDIFLLRDFFYCLSIELEWVLFNQKLYKTGYLTSWLIGLG